VPWRRYQYERLRPTVFSALAGRWSALFFNCLVWRDRPGRGGKGEETPTSNAERRSIVAYYSTAETDPKVYHVCRNCHVGNNIGKQYLAVGKPPGYRLCKRCKELQDNGDCEPGIPTPAR